MTEILNSIKAILYDRAVSPLFGTFAAAWTFWNYKFFLVLFSSMEIEGKLSYINYVLYDDDKFWKLPATDYSVSSTLLVYPLCTTLFALVLYPLLSLPTYAYSRYFASLMRKVKEKFEGEELLTVSQSRDIRRVALQQAKEFGDIIEARIKEITDLKKINSDLDAELMELKKKLSDLKTSKDENLKNRTEEDKNSDPIDKILTPHYQTPFSSQPKHSKVTASQLDILKQFNSADVITDGAVFRNHPQGKIFARYDLNALLNLDFIKKSDAYVDDEGESINVYSLTEKGIAYLVENDLN